jgi:hypothetical protein
MYKNDESKISVFERKVLRKIYGPVNDKGKWRIRFNNELYQLLGEPDIQGSQSKESEVAGTSL